MNLEKKTIEEIKQEGWKLVDTFANDCLILTKEGKGMIYNSNTKEILCRYSLEGMER